MQCPGAIDKVNFFFFVSNAFPSLMLLESVCCVNTAG